MTLKNAKHEAFCHEYLKDFNGTAAYRRVYKSVSEEAARRNASRLLTNADVQKRVKELTVERLDKVDSDVEDILREYKNIAFFDIADVLKWDGDYLVVRSFEEVPKEARKVISEIKQIPATKESSASLHIKFCSKQAALDALSRYHGLFNDKLNIDANVKTESFEEYLARKKNENS